MNTDATYGQRSCLFCGKAFESAYENYMCCSQACQRKLMAQLKNLFAHRISLGRKEAFDALKARVADLEKEVESLKLMSCRERKDARKKLDQLRAELKHTQIELALKQSELDAAREKGAEKGAEPVEVKLLSAQKENRLLKSYVKELEERLQACGAMV